MKVNIAIRKAYNKSFYLSKSNTCFNDEYELNSEEFDNAFKKIIEGFKLAFKQKKNSVETINILEKELDSDATKKKSLSLRLRRENATLSKI